MLRAAFLLSFASLAATAAGAQSPQRPLYQTEADAYTRYELLAPGSAKFRIVYEITATTPGMTAYYNPIRKGSVATDEHVSDRMTGAPLPFAVVHGAEARAGGVRNADSATDYIKVTLPRPVPPEGQVRLLIDKTYEDARSYFVQDGLVVFSRPLGIKRNAVLLPAGYELIACNYPSQVIRQPDGRLLVAFIGLGAGEVPLTLKARKLP